MLIFRILTFWTDILVNMFHVLVESFTSCLLQGAVVALIFCFFNGEVHSYLRNTIGRHIKLGSSKRFTRKNSMSTTQITSFTSSRRNTKTYEHSDRGYIPLSTSTTANDVTTATTTPVSPTSTSNGHVTFSL